MEKNTILYIGRNAEILNTVVRLINGYADWLGFGALDNNATAKILSKHSIDIVLLGAGISDQSDLLYESFFLQKKIQMLSLCNITEVVVY
jgi:hypothetical protein